MKYLKYILITLSLLLFIRGFSVFISAQAVKEADNAVEEGDVELAIQNYDLAKSVNSFDPKIFKSLANVYFQLSFSVGTQESEKSINLAEKNILISLDIEESSGGYEFYGNVLKRKIAVWKERGRSEGIKEAVEKLENAFRNAVELYPAGAHVSYRNLVELDFWRGNYREVVNLADKILPFYLDEAFRSITWMDPNKEKIKENLRIIRSFAGVSALALGEKDKAAGYFDKSEKGLTCALLAKMPLDAEHAKDAKDIFEAFCKK